MTGMLNFNFSLYLLSIATFVGAAEISFVGKNKISGDLLAMDPDGTLTINTPYASEPLKINPDGIHKIDFGKSDLKYERPNHNLRLINGDSFPVEIISLDEKILKIHSPSLGELNVPREIINSLEVGIFSKKIVYTGPNEIGEWRAIKEEQTAWDIENNALRTKSSGTIYRDVKLPENYIVRFKLKWETVPNFKFSFGDPLDFSGNSVNRYYLQYSSAGMEIKRQSTGNQKYPSIANIPRTPQEFKSNELIIEVRVSRKTGNIELYLNDRIQGKYTDNNPPNTPTGSGISFHTEASNNNQHSISNIEISEWNDREDSNRVEERGDINEDAVIGRNGERYGGRILSIINDKDSSTYRFKSHFQANPIDMPHTDVSTLYFASSPTTKFENIKGMNLFFQGRGSFQISKCSISGDIINITHPLLGDLQLNRNVVSQLERSISTNANPKNIDKVPQSIR
jgi:hypothetical protein